MPEPRSIRTRLLLWIGLPFVGLSILALLSSHLLLSRQINETFDAMLLNAAERLERRIYTSNGELRINMHYFSISTLGSRGEGKIFYRIREADGDMIAGFNGLDGPPGALDYPVFYDVDYAGNALRAVALVFPVLRGREPVDIEVVVAESKEARRLLVHDFMMTLTGLMAVGGILAVTIALLAIHWGLAPLDNISRALRRRSPNDLEPLDAKAPSEILPLIQSINHLMQMMRRSIRNTQQLNADVSHQLRTPVSEIRALTELTLKSTHEAQTRANLTEIRRIAEHAGHTVQQLLRYAKTRNELIDTSSLETVDLAAVCRDACAQTATGIYQKGQELEFTLLDDAPRIVGDPIMLLWLVINLIENASLHAGGAAQYRGVIHVEIGRGEDTLYLSVHDNGVGADEAHLARLTERFFRADQRAPGSGLGLAIVEQIARAHGARLELRNRPEGGFEVRIHFASLKPSPRPRASASPSTVS